MLLFNPIIWWGGIMTFARKIAGLGTAVVVLAAFASAVFSPAVAADAAKNVPVYREYVQGNPNAKVIVIEYASLPCRTARTFRKRSCPN